MQGIILLDKQINKTSREMINELTHIFYTKKIGHTGTLDPIATGILVVLIGKYTKLNDLLLSLKKEYIAKIKVGFKTDTLDITGNIVDQNDVLPNKEDVIRIINGLHGKYQQKVPMYSAKKVNGKKLYEYARKGQIVNAPVNEIEIFESEFISYEDDIITFKVLVSKGTYIRSLIEKICDDLNILGSMCYLRRTKQGNFSIDDSVTLNNIKQGKYRLLTASEVLDYPIYHLNKNEYNKVVNGSKLSLNIDSEHIILVYDNKEIAIYQKQDDYYKPKIML